MTVGADSDGDHDPEMVGELAGECRTAMELGAEPTQLFVGGSEQREATLQRLRQGEHSRTEPIGLVGKAFDIVGTLESGQQGGAGGAGHVHASRDDGRAQPVLLTRQEVQDTHHTVCRW